MMLLKSWKTTKSFWTKFFCVSLVLLSGGCDKINDLFSGEMVPEGMIMLKQEIKLQRLLISSEKSANKGRAFEVHVVLTKNLQMAKELSEMSAKDYFKAYKSKEFNKDFHGLYKVFKFDVMPGKKLPEKKLKIDSGSKYVGGYFFAKLQHPKGSNRIRIPSSTHVMLKFTKDGMSLVSPDLLSEGEEMLEEKLSIPSVDFLD